MKIKENINVVNFFLVFFLLNTVITFLMLFFTDGQFLSEIVWDARHPPLANDFIAPIGAAVTGRPYDYDVFYPPFVMFIYYLLGKMIPSLIVNSDVNNWYLLFANMTLCISVAGIVLFADRILKDFNTFIKVGLCFCFILSQPFGFSECASFNSCIWALLLIMPALYYKDSENKICREISLILIAMAANIKLTPAVFGLLWLSEKRYKETCRLILYGILFFILPMFFFGGFSILSTMFRVTGEFSGTFEDPRPETICGCILKLAQVLGIDSSIGLKVGQLLSLLYFVVVVIIFCITKHDWKSLFLLSTFNVILINHSYPYTLIYLFPAMLYYLKEDGNNRRIITYVYGIMMVMIFAGYPFIKIDIPTATFISNYFWLYIMIILVFIDVFFISFRN